MLYLNCEVLLLADVFETVRKTAISQYKLDPAKYITIASYAWDAMRLNTGIVLHFIAEQDLLEIVEKSKRGGYTFVVADIYVKANNNQLEEYDETIEPTYILYIDTNILYRLAMCQYLPCSDIRTNNDIPYDDVTNTSYDADIGYMVEVYI